MIGLITVEDFIDEMCVPVQRPLDVLVSERIGNGGGVAKPYMPR